MNMNWKKKMNRRWIAKPKGFTLIEFLVASALAIIVISAAGGTYFMTRKVNDAAQRKLEIQQNLRNAASMLTRDARNAGTFGCFNMASGRDFPVLTSGLTSIGLKINNTENDGLGVRQLSQANVTTLLTGQRLVSGGFTAESNALVFVYGRGAAGVNKEITDAQPNKLSINDASNDPDLNLTLSDKGYLVLSSCTEGRLAKVTGVDSGFKTVDVSIDTNNALSSIMTDSKDSRGEITVSRFYASMYVLGKLSATDSPALLRFDLNGQGKWQGPQLLAEGVLGMSISYGYITDCTNLTATNVSRMNQEKYTFTKTLSSKTLPAIVRLHLTYNTSADKANHSETDYFINASVRGGNTCGTVLPVL